MNGTYYILSKNIILKNCKIEKTSIETKMQRFQQTKIPRIIFVRLRKKFGEKNPLGQNA
jgi:hypothetical protein